MILLLFDFFFSIINGIFDLIGRAADLGMRFLSALVNFWMKAFIAVFNLIAAPFTQGADRLLDWTALDLRGLFSLVLWVLLAACALLAVLAAGSNAYRMYRQRMDK